MKAGLLLHYRYTRVTQNTRGCGARYQRGDSSLQAKKERLLDGTSEIIPLTVTKANFGRSVELI